VRENAEQCKNTRVENVGDVPRTFTGKNDHTDPMTEPSRRFPIPWRPDRIPGGYVVRDATGQIVSWVYARASTAEAMQANVLTLDEARRIATNIARLPELLRQRDE
jgi:hypothetical protein